MVCCHHSHLHSPPAFSAHRPLLHSRSAATADISAHRLLPLITASSASPSASFSPLLRSPHAALITATSSARGPLPTPTICCHRRLLLCSPSAATAVIAASCSAHHLLPLLSPPPPPLPLPHTPAISFHGPLPALTIVCHCCHCCRHVTAAGGLSMVRQCSQWNRT